MRGRAERCGQLTLYGAASRCWFGLRWRDGGNGLALGSLALAVPFHGVGRSGHPVQIVFSSHISIRLIGLQPLP